MKFLEFFNEIFDLCFKVFFYDLFFILAITMQIVKHVLHSNGLKLWKKISALTMSQQFGFF